MPFRYSGHNIKTSFHSLHILWAAKQIHKINSANKKKQNDACMSTHVFINILTSIGFLCSFICEELSIEFPGTNKFL